jgi:ketosteroid isomerase-like protein
MDKVFSLLIQLMLLTGLVACNNSPTTSVEAIVNIEREKDTIRHHVQQFMQAFQAKDSLALASFYTTDGLVLPPNSTAVSKEQNAAMWGSVFRMGLTELKLTITDISGDAAFLTETGEYQMYAGDQQVDYGKYLVVWKKEEGTWKMFRDIWNTSQPPAN